MREAPALTLIRKFKKAGAELTAYDPVAIKEAKRRIGDEINYGKDAYDCLIDADCLIVVTEWSEFRSPNWSVINKLMNEKVVFDGRNIYEREYVEEAGFKYFGIGR